MTDPTDSPNEPLAAEAMILRRRRRRRQRQVAQRRRRLLLCGAAVVALAGLIVALVLDRGQSDVVADATGTVSSTTLPSAPSTTQSTTVPQSTTSPSTSAPASECSSVGWPIDRQARLLVFATLDGSRAQLEEIAGSGVGGVFVSTAAVPLLTDGTVKRAAEEPVNRPLIAVDEEGGRVQRLRNAIGALPPARTMAQLSEGQIRNLAREHGAKMLNLGVTVDFAPVVDLVEDAALSEDNGIGDRSFSADPALAASAAGAFAAGLDDAGVLPTYKHFPGHGHVSGDSHKELPITPSLESMRQQDLKPFVTLLAEGSTPAAVMIGHLNVPGLTDGEPATVSKPAISGLLRGELGFQGLVVSDDLGGMRAIKDRYSTVEAAVLAVAAGTDMVLVPADESQAVTEAIVEAVASGRIPAAQLAASTDRVLRAQQGESCQQF